MYFFIAVRIDLTYGKSIALLLPSLYRCIRKFLMAERQELIGESTTIYNNFKVYLVFFLSTLLVPLTTVISSLSPTICAYSSSIFMVFFDIAGSSQLCRSYIGLFVSISIIALLLSNFSWVSWFLLGWLLASDTWILLINYLEPEFSSISLFRLCSSLFGLLFSIFLCYMREFSILSI